MAPVYPALCMLAFGRLTPQIPLVDLFVKDRPCANEKRFLLWRIHVCGHALLLSFDE